MIDGERVRTLREQLGLTQAELADLAGMTAAAVSQVETGKRHPYARTARRLAAALGVELPELYPDGMEERRYTHTITRQAALRADVWDKGAGVCFYCGATLHPIRDFHVEHVIPRCAGGTDDMENLVASCGACNMEKNHTEDKTRCGRLRRR
jgi:transcriptional regulator with XRE-family HTH domain